MFLFYVKQKNKQTKNYKQSKSELNYMSSWNSLVFSGSKMRDTAMILCKMNHWELFILTTHGANNCPLSLGVVSPKLLG